MISNHKTKICFKKSKICNKKRRCDENEVLIFQESGLEFWVQTSCRCFFSACFLLVRRIGAAFFVWEGREESIRLELSFPRARTQEFTLKSDSILVAAGFKMFRAKTRIFWQWRPSDRSNPSLAKSFIFWESMEAYTWGFAVFSLFVAAKSYAVRHFTTQIYREAARRATTIRHQPTVLCALFKMAAQEFRSGWKAVLWKSKRKSVR